MYRDQYMKSSLKSVTAPWRSFIRPELIVEPSVPSYPVDNLPFVPKSTDCFGEATALERRQSRRAAWVFAPFDHPYNITDNDGKIRQTQKPADIVVQCTIISVQPISLFYVRTSCDTDREFS
ncbi:hypothetical protein GQ600_17757 [Phytophthora cactorum]|nr:hypothetical protein GQ600_17757 [Phytophthora cactorum]